MVEIKYFTDGVEVEDEARQQIENVAALPIVGPHIAIMPDVHWGIGATVGSVIPTTRAIIPAAVGVDIGCVDAETEYLSPEGWKRIVDYSGGDVMQYCPDSGEGEFITPSAYIREPCEQMLAFHTKYGIDQVVSPEHRVLVWRMVDRDRDQVPVVLHAEDLAEEHNRLVLGAKVNIETSFRPKLKTAIPYSDEELRVQVMVMADGSIVKLARGYACQLKLRKQRKIERARRLLVDAAIAFTEHVHGNDTTFRFRPPSPEKSYGGFWAASLAQLHLIADECVLWDGHAADAVFFTRNRASADFIHYAFSATGRRAVLRRDGLDYRVFAYDKTRVGMAGSPKSPVREVPSPDGWKYCFTVPSGFWVMRRGGNIAMTGNCGMLAVRTNVRANDLDLPRVRREIEDAIPIGGPGIPGSWSEARFQKGENWGTPRESRNGWEALLAPRWATIAEKYPKLAKHRRGDRAPTVTQLGTLGTGNHFIEICVEVDHADPSVWIMLHSGSRGPGNRIGTYFIERAKEHWTRHGGSPLLHGGAPLPDLNLAWLEEGSDLFNDYVEAVSWAQEYAQLNRKLMLNRVIHVLNDHTGNQHWPIELSTPVVNCHHNYVEFRSDGQYLTRKGAVSAQKGELGIIPGSMGARSFIVRGLGNPDSFESCSHGAGRRMSRGKARKLISLDDHIAATAGVECRKDADVIDESPAAYKDIDAVMHAQRDLVEIVHTLKQIVCVKG